MNNVNITLYDHIAFEYINKQLSIDNLIYKTGVKLFCFDIDKYYINLNNILFSYYKNNNLINKAIIKKLMLFYLDCPLKFFHIIKNDNIYLLRFIFENDKYKNDIQQDYSYYVNRICEDGNIDMLNLIYDKSKLLGFDFKYTPRALLKAFENNHLNIIEWFWNRKDEIPFKYTTGCINIAYQKKYMNIILWYYYNKEHPILNDEHMNISPRGSVKIVE